MQVTQKYWAVANKDYCERGWNLRLLNWDPKGVEGYILVRDDPYELTIEVPDAFDFRLGMADAIRAEIKKVQADAQNKITELTEALNSILAIEG